MKRPELYLYLVLTAYLIVSTVGLWLMGYLLGWNPQATVMLSAKLTALPFLAWIALSVYYLLRWYVRHSARKPIK
jgi:membrane protein DedA with SNARE-associated domain